MVPRTIRAAAIVISIAIMTGMAVGYILDQRVQYVTPRALSPDVERASVDVAKLSQP
jgi:hypothetical protein